VAGRGWSRIERELAGETGPLPRGFPRVFRGKSIALLRVGRYCLEGWCSNFFMEPPRGGTESVERRVESESTTTSPRRVSAVADLRGAVNETVLAIHQPASPTGRVRGEIPCVRGDGRGDHSGVSTVAGRGVWIGSLADDNDRHAGGTGVGAGRTATGLARGTGGFGSGTGCRASTSSAAGSTHRGPSCASGSGWRRTTGGFGCPTGGGSGSEHPQADEADETTAS